MNLILHHHSGRANGTLTSMIDTYFNLQDVELKIISGDHVHNTIQFIRDNDYFGDKGILNCLTKDLSFEANTIICSAKLLVDINVFNIKIKCKRMIVLDSLDIFKLNKNIVSFSIPTLDMIFLCNPANKVPFKTHEYYHKFSHKRLDTLKKSCELQIYSRMSRDDIIVDNIPFENIGKRVWENLYHGTKVLYQPDGLRIEDGLCYYMKLFGLDCNKEKILSVTREQIVDKLFMKEDDLIYELLS